VSISFIETLYKLGQSCTQLASSPRMFLCTTRWSN